MMEGERDDGAVWRLVTDHPDVFENSAEAECERREVLLRCQ